MKPFHPFFFCSLELFIVRQDAQIPGCIGYAQFSPQICEIKRCATSKGDLAILAWPLLLRAIPRQFDAVEIRVMYIDRFMCQVIGSTIDGPAAVQQTFE